MTLIRLTRSFIILKGVVAGGKAFEYFYDILFAYGRWRKAYHKCVSTAF